MPARIPVRPTGWRLLRDSDTCRFPHTHVQLNLTFHSHLQSGALSLKPCRTTAPDYTELLSSEVWRTTTDELCPTLTWTSASFQNMRWDPVWPVGYRLVSRYPASKYGCHWFIFPNKWPGRCSGLTKPFPWKSDKAHTARALTSCESSRLHRGASAALWPPLEDMYSCGCPSRSAWCKYYQHW